MHPELTAYIQLRERLPKNFCPSCAELFDAVTDVQIGHDPKPDRELKGNITVCAYCGEILMFVDNTGSLRALTPEERRDIRLAPEIQELIDGIRQKKRRS